jgi:acyl-CoA thioesterase II
MNPVLRDILELLDVERIEENLFRGRNAAESEHVFGGQVLAQAIGAANRTIDGDRRIHSIHAYFLRPGDWNVPILYQVDRIRDGRSFTTRRVVAIQQGQAIFNLQASFHVTEAGLDYQVPMPQVPDPRGLPDMRTRMAPYKDKMGDWLDRPRPIDLRYIGPSPMERRDVRDYRQQVWLRADGRLPDDPVLHACVVTYASDLTLLDTTVLPHGVSWSDTKVQMASLDHAMWFHRPFRADEWLLYDQITPSTSNARGLAAGSIYTESGDLVVSVVQEGMIRTGAT